ncbi:hypothetical protein C1645_830557 [Glomus cerebriforme]|uniref:Uncharacterized protein n=1 Tax=Glomus cerebriforme TaxID=658196 RepID=A0A397SSF4_9GLOM|nr:hypothetical protein C1645_830557 [Glomus cerebriforme]
MENAYYNSEESEKEVNKGGEKDCYMTSGQMLVEDLVEGFYIVFPRLTFEFPTRLQHIKNLKSAVNIKYKGSLKTVMKKAVLKYNNGNKNTDYSRNKNHRLTSFQKLVSADDEEYDESNASDE